MTREAIGTGQTIEQAKEDAINQLGLSVEDEYQIEIIELPHKKTLGIFGGSPAKVRIYIDDGNDSDLSEDVKADVISDNGEKETDIREDAKKEAAYTDKEALLVSQYIRSILENLGVENCQADVQPDEEAMRIVLSGDNISLAIGRRGETLDALQYLCSVVANHNRGKFLRVVLDTGNYREKREKTLENLAKNMAAKAKRTGRNQMLEPMNPYERRIIHTAVQEIDGISSWSVGEGGSRRVIIGRKRGEGSAHRGYGRNSAQNDRTVKREIQTKNDLDGAPLYGRIDK